MAMVLLMRLAYSALIFIPTVACIPDELQEAHEIYQSVNEALPLQDQYVLMELFSKDNLPNNQFNQATSFGSTF